MENKNIIYLGFRDYTTKDIKRVLKLVKEAVKAADKEAIDKILKDNLIFIDNLETDDYKVIKKAICDATGVNKYYDNDKKRYKYINWHNKYRDETFYCTNCKTKFNDKSYAKYPILDLEKEKIICPHCGNRSYIKLINDRYITFRKIYNDKDPDKITIAVGAIRYEWRQGRLVNEKEVVRVCINMRTGYSYVFPKQVIKYNKINKIGAFHNCTYELEQYISSIINSTVTTNNNCLTLIEYYKEIYNMIRDYKIKNYNNYIPTFEENFSEEIYNYYDNNDTKKILMSITITDILLFNRMPFFNPLLTDKILTTTITNKKERKKIRSILKQEDTDGIKTLLLKNKIPATKKNKKYVRKIGYNFILIYKNLIDITCADNIYKIINAMVNTSSINNNNMYIGDVYYKLEPMIEFLKTYPDKITKQAINNYCNKLLRLSQEEDYYKYGHDVIDTFKQLNKICSANKDYKVNWRLGIEDLHDVVTSDYLLIKNQNMIINYDHLDNKEKQFEGEYNDLHFALAKDTDELIKTGSYMHICVGSYREYALNHDSYIVIAKDENNIPIICIEIDSNLKTLVQAKLKYNEAPQADIIGEALKNWIEDNKIEASSCYDMRHVYFD